MGSFRLQQWNKKLSKKGLGTGFHAYSPRRQMHGFVQRHAGKSGPVEIIRSSELLNEEDQSSEQSSGAK